MWHPLKVKKVCQSKSIIYYYFKDNFLMLFPLLDVTKTRVSRVMLFGF